MRGLVALAMLAPLTACSFGQDVGPANKAIQTFHQLLDAGKFEQIYDGSDDLMKRATPRADLDKILTLVHTRLGAFKSGTTVGWNENLNTSGKFVSINYSAQYERGQATESFNFIIVRDQPKLVGFNINSPALLADLPAAAPSPTPLPAASSKVAERATQTN